MKTILLITIPTAFIIFTLIDYYLRRFKFGREILGISLLLILAGLGIAETYYDNTNILGALKLALVLTAVYASSCTVVYADTDIEQNSHQANRGGLKFKRTRVRLVGTSWNARLLEKDSCEAEQDEQDSRRLAEI